MKKNKEKKDAALAAYKMLDISIRQTQKNENTGMVLLVTSSVCGEGKTFVTAQYAQQVAANGRNVLVVDTVPGSMEFSQAFRFEKSGTGFYDVMEQHKANVEAAIRKNVQPNISVLEAGIPQSRAALQGTALKALFEQLKGSYDVVLVDTASVNESADTLELAKWADAVVFVVRQNGSAEKEIASAQKQLALVDANVIGAVLNAYDKKRFSLQIEMRAIITTHRHRIL